MSYKKPLPQPNPDTRPFWEWCKKHELRLQKCLDCEHLRWPAALICPKCYSKDSEWVRVSGRGKLYTYTVYHVAFHDSFKEDLPYVTAIVELEEGPHMLTSIVGAGLDDLECAMPVEVTWDDITEEFTLPKFTLVRR